MIGSTVDPLIEKMLDWTAQRQQVLSANIANMDTPGYRAEDVSFDSEMNNSLQLASTSNGHMALPDNDSNTRVYEVAADVQGNGNTVDLENQMSELTKNGIQYTALVDFFNSDLKRLRYSISEGGKV